METKPCVAVLIIATFLLSVAFGSFAVSPSVPDKSLPTLKTAALASHDPIVIDGDGGFTNASGVIWGSGISSDPFVIGGWIIDAVGASGAGIFVNNTTSDFLIDEVAVNLGGIGVGILLQRTFNGTLNNLTVSDCQKGISFQTVDDCSILDAQVSACAEEGIFLFDVVNVTVSNCIIQNNDVGIRELVYLRNRGTRDFVGNIFIGNNRGLQLGKPHSVAVNNSFSSNVIGLWCSVGWATITGNLFTDSSSFAVQIVAQAPSVSVWNNTFVGNNGASSTYDSTHIQAYDDGTNTRWNLSGYGNYWSDWQTPDVDHDGIVDIPYQLADNPIHPVAGKDYFPLTTAPAIGEFDFAPVVVSFIFVIAVILWRREREAA